MDIVEGSKQSGVDINSEMSKACYIIFPGILHDFMKGMNPNLESNEWHMAYIFLASVLHFRVR